MQRHHSANISILHPSNRFYWRNRIVFLCVADKGPRAIATQIDGFILPHSQYSSVVERVVVFDKVSASCTDALTDALAAIHAPAILSAELIQIDSLGSVPARTGWTVASGTVSSTDVCISCRNKY